jgi:hypothetical protein
MGGLVVWVMMTTAPQHTEHHPPRHVSRCTDAPGGPWRALAWAAGHKESNNYASFEPPNFNRTLHAYPRLFLIFEVARLS